MFLHFGTLHNKKQRNDKRKAQWKERREQEKRKRTTDKMGRGRKKERAAGPGQRLIKAVKNCEKLLKRFSQGRQRKTEKEQEKERRVERGWAHEKCHTKREL